MKPAAAKDVQYGKVYREAVLDRSLGQVTAFHVLALLLTYADARTGTGYIVMPKAAAELGIHVRSLQRHIGKLIDCGRLEIIRQRRSGPGNDFRILYPNATHDVGSPSQPAPPDATHGVALAHDPAELEATHGVALADDQACGQPVENDRTAHAESDTMCRYTSDTKCHPNHTYLNRPKNLEVVGAVGEVEKLLEHEARQDGAGRDIARRAAA